MRGHGVSRRQFPRCTRHRGVLYRHNLLDPHSHNINLTELRANKTGGWMARERSRLLIPLKSAPRSGPRELASNLIRSLIRKIHSPDNPVLLGALE